MLKIEVPSEAKIFSYLAILDIVVGLDLLDDCYQSVRYDLKVSPRLYL